MIPKSVEVSGHQVLAYNAIIYVCCLSVVLCHRQIFSFDIYFLLSSVLGSTARRGTCITIISFLPSCAIRLCWARKVRIGKQQPICQLSDILGIGDSTCACCSGWGGCNRVLFLRVATGSRSSSLQLSAAKVLLFFEICK